MSKPSQIRWLAVISFVALGALAAVVLSSNADRSRKTADANETRRGAKWNAKWAFRPASAKELASGSEVIVTGEVVNIRAGEPLVTHGATDVEPIPTQIITLRITSAIKGRVPKEIEFTKTGTQDNWIEDDPPFAVGSTYVMYLARRGKNLFVPVGPDGRIEIKPNGDLHLDSNSPVEDQVTRLNSETSEPAEALATTASGS